MAYVTLRPRRLSGVDYAPGAVVPDELVTAKMLRLGVVADASVPLTGSYLRTHPFAGVTAAQVAAATEDGEAPTPDEFTDEFDLAFV